MDFSASSITYQLCGVNLESSFILVLELLFVLAFIAIILSLLSFQLYYQYHYFYSNSLSVR